MYYTSPLLVYTVKVNPTEFEKKEPRTHISHFIETSRKFNLGITTVLVDLTKHVFLTEGELPLFKRK